MSLPLFTVILSLGLQAAASAVAFRLAMRTRRTAFLLLSLATFLMAVRRGFSMLLLGQRPLDGGAEAIALVISVLILAALLGLRRQWPTDPTRTGGTASASHALGRVERTALLLGGLGLVGGGAAAFRAYGSSREAILEAETRSCGVVARALRGRAELRAAEGRPPVEVAADLRGLWEELRFEPRSYLCLVDAHGRLTLNTQRPEAVGTDVGSSTVGASGNKSTLRDLLRSERSYEGVYLSPQGEEQVVAFAYSSALTSLIAVHVPLDVVAARVRRATIPWAVTLFVAVAAIFPIGLIILDWGYRTATDRAQKAVDALTRSEQSLALALEAGGMGSFDWDVKSGQIHWTEGHARLWGLALEDFDGRYETFARGVHPEDLPALERAVAVARESHQPYQERYRVVWPDGSWHPVEGKGRFYYDGAGQAVRMTGIVTDVSRQVQVEEELQIRARQQAAVATLGQAALLSNSAPEVLNQASVLLTTILGVQYAKVLELLPDGKSLRLREGVGWRDGAVGREIVPATPASQAGYTLGQSQPVVVEDLAEESRFSGNELLLTHGVVSGMSVIIQGQKGHRPFGVLGVHATRKRLFSPDDVHFLESIANILAAAMEGLRSEAAHRQAEERFAAAFLSSPAAMSISTLAEGRYLVVNDRFVALSGYAREEILGRTVRDLDWWEDFDQRAAVVHSLSEAGSVRDVAFRYRTRDRAPHEAIGSFVRMEAGGEPCILSLIEDVTERRRLEAQLAQSQKMEAVGSLAGGIAHDFNNLLNVIIGYGEMLRKELPAEPASARRRIDQILKAAERAATLTRQLLAFSRRQVLQPRVVALNDVVHDVESLLRRVIGEDVDLATALGADVGRVKIDPGQIEQVILNLAINARDAMPRGGRLTIETSNAEQDESRGKIRPAVEPGRYVLLVVSDTGHGMDVPTQARAFEPFFTTKPEGKGTGLGLATAYGIVKQSGGYIWLLSELERGTTFEIYLPRVDEPLSSSKSSIEVPDPRGGETIALVEDSAAARGLVREVLQGYGYTVLSAEDGDHALDLLAKHPGPVHLLLTDVVMPGISGPVLWERARDSRPEMKVLFMSGYTDEVMGRHGVLGLGVDLIEKPFTPDDLGRRVRQALAGARDSPRG